MKENIQNELIFNQEQIEKIIETSLDYKIFSKEQFFTLALQSIMKSDRKIFLKQLKNNEINDDNNKGNGYYNKRIPFDNQMLQVRIPRDRNGIFKPFILELIKENQSKIAELSFSLYAKGLTDKEIKDVIKLIYNKDYSRSGISNLYKEIKEDVLSWYKRDINSYYPVVYIDAIYQSVRRGDSVSKEAFYVVLGLKPDFTREVITIENYPTESSTNWEEIFINLKERGLKKVNLIVADGLKGIETAASKYFKDVEIQLCVTHLKRYLLSKVKKSDKDELKEDLNNLFLLEQTNYTYSDVEKKLDLLHKKWYKKYKSIGDFFKSERVPYYFTYLKYDRRIHRMIYTTNYIENLNKSFRRTLKIRNSLPNIKSALTLIGAVAIEKNETNAYNRRLYQFKYEEKFNNCFMEEK